MSFKIMFLSYIDTSDRFPSHRNKTHKQWKTNVYTISYNKGIVVQYLK